MVALNKRINRSSRTSNLISREFTLKRDILSFLDNLRFTLQSCNDMLLDLPLNIHRHLESGVVGEMKAGEIDTKESMVDENFMEVVGDAVANGNSLTSLTDNIGISSLLTLSDYIHRPVEIATFVVAPSTSISNSYDLWSLLSLKPSVRAKLRNYAYMKANLRVRISISGSPFHYGRLLFSYQPYAIHNSALQALLASVAINSSLRPLLLSYLSQSKQSWYMDVKDNQPFEITLPFISYKPCFKLFNTASVNTVVASGTPFEDFSEAGSLFVYSMNSVESVSSTPSDVSVQIYAWFEDAQLGCPTAAQIGISTESGKVDERHVGPVEKLSSKMAQASGVLTSIPVIEPFASVSKIAFSTLSKVSAIFGWSRPVIISNPSYVKNNGFSNGAQTIGSETNFRITLDPEQEVSVDPDLFGSSEDEMHLNYLCSLPSYFDTFTWSPTDLPMTNSIFTCGVNPCHAVRFIGATEFVQPTSLCFAAIPFEYWRGDIIFKFDVVCSAYHRGKLAIVYEPVSVQSTLITSNTEFNKQYLAIIDLQQTQSVELCVNWNSYRSWLRTLQSTEAGLISGSSFSPAAWHTRLNGYIIAVPFTTLQSPDDSSVQINVSVRSDNMCFNGLRGAGYPRTRLRLESGRVMSSSSRVEAEEPKGVSCVELAPSSATDSYISHHYFGEQPSSFRSLLKRYVRTESVSAVLTPAAAGSIIYTNVIMPRILNMYSSSPTPVTITNLFDYLRYAYLGYKGGIKKRILIWDDGVDNVNSQVKIYLDNPGTTNAIPGISTTTLFSEDGLPGLVSFTPHSNAGVEVELPFYSNNLFGFSCLPTNSPTGTLGQYEQTYYRNFGVRVYYSTTPTNCKISEESAIGDDFSFFRFLGAPYYTV